MKAARLYTRSENRRCTAPFPYGKLALLCWLLLLGQLFCIDFTKQNFPVYSATAALFALAGYIFTLIAFAKSLSQAGRRRAGYLQLTGLVVLLFFFTFFLHLLFLFA